MKYLVSIVLLLLAIGLHAGEIHVQANNGNIEAVKRIIKADPGLIKSKTQDEWLLPIHLAAQNCNIEVLKYLITHGSPIDPLDKNRGTPLLRASLSGGSACVKVLIAAGANTNLVADEGITPLHLAAMNGHYEVVLFLIESGAKVNVKDDTGASPMDFALTKDIKNLLRRHGSK